MKITAYCIIVCDEKLQEFLNDCNAECNNTCPLRYSPHCCHHSDVTSDFSCWYATVQKEELPKDFFQKVVIII